jgi:uncharacterized damage-inducible protein DinB
MTTKKTLPDGRPVPPAHADERAMLETWLDFQRATLALKCEDLDDAQLRECSAPPSELTLLGLVQHLAEVERQWWRRVFEGDENVEPLYGGRPGDAFTLVEGRGLDEAKADWQREIDHSREITADASLDDTGRLDEFGAGFLGSETVSLRWILVHLIEEYARHLGHADLLRERIDGRTGV